MRRDIWEEEEREGREREEREERSALGDCRAAARRTAGRKAREAIIV
jgi:hypothetical protein